MDYFYYVRDTLRTAGAPGRTRTDTGRIYLFLVFSSHATTGTIYSRIRDYGVDVITRFPDPEAATATNVPLPYVTPYQLLSEADVREVQVIPSGLVITRFPDPVSETATNVPLP